MSLRKGIGFCQQSEAWVNPYLLKLFVYLNSFSVLTVYYTLYTLMNVFLYSLGS